MQHALKARDNDSVRTLRTLLAKLNDASIAKRDNLSEEEEIRVLRKAAREREESIELYKKGERDDLAEIESKELSIIESYLPESLSEDELVAMIEAVIQESGATGMNDIGKVMPLLIKKVAGRAGGKQIHELVRRRLGG